MDDGGLLGGLETESGQEFGRALGDFLAEQWFGVVGLVVGLALSTYFYWRQRQNKTLDYDPAVVSLLPRQSHAFDNLTIAYKGAPMTAPHVVTIQIINTGQRSVTAADYAKPITIQFEKGEPIEGVVVDHSWDGPIGFDSIFGDPLRPRQPVMTPALLLSGDHFTVQLLIDQHPGEVRVSSRFADQTRGMTNYRHDYFGEAMSEALRAAPRKTNRRPRTR